VESGFPQSSYADDPSLAESLPTKAPRIIFIIIVDAILEDDWFRCDGIWNRFSVWIWNLH
jgi:hypothetical protein